LRKEADDVSDEITVCSDPELRSVHPGRGAAIRFLVQFCVVTLVALVGYGYLVSTQVHLRYMLELSRHTVWMLNLTGGRVELEPTRGDRTAWDAWRDRAVAAREVGRNLEDEGPIVFLALNSTDAHGFPRSFSFKVVPNCGAVPIIVIYVAAVLLFPVPFKKRLIGAVAGTVILYVINVVRLSILAWVGAIDSTPERRWFTFVHEYVWQGVYISIVVLVWLGWYALFVRGRARVEG
jgi:exosortase/archaeosortase family protein